MPVTLYELAQAADCSVSTVSRVLNNSKHPISEATRERIFTLAREMGYRPNVAARGLKTNRTYTIGLIVDNIGGPFTPIIIRGIQEYLQQHDYFSVIISTGWDPELKSEAVHQLISRSIDGIIFVESWRDETNNTLDLANKPYVYVYRLFDGDSTNSVLLDDFHGACLAVEHLVSLGHRRIAYINGPHGWVSSKERLEGYQAVLAHYGIPFEPTLVAEGTWEIQSGYPAAKKILALPEHPTAIFAANDLMALGAIYAIQDAGLNVPNDIAVVGCDDRDLASFSHPTITTVCPPSFEMGQSAAQLILDRLENHGEMKGPLRLQGKLIIRESCGSPEMNIPPDHFVSHTLPPEHLIRQWRGKIHSESENPTKSSFIKKPMAIKNVRGDTKPK
jgi:DNA-binding LacI/PurR family transcriptional regulator